MLDILSSFPMEDIPIYYDVVGQEEEFEKALGLIQEDINGVGVVGIWGMGGIGKTTLLLRINNYFHSNSCGFDVVIFTTAGREKSSILEMQQDIGERLGISLLETRDERKRARQIFMRLRSTSFLLLVDDLWEEIDLKRLGIPPLYSSSPVEGGSQQGQEQGQEKEQEPEQETRKMKKVVITTRDRAICHDMGSTHAGIIEVGLLTRDLSWKLFCMSVNNNQLLKANPEVAALAIDIAYECHRLPLALVTVGKAMSRYVEPYEWRNAKAELKRSAFPAMTEKVWSEFKFSFDRLRSDSMRQIMFLCLLPPSGASIQSSALFRKIELARLAAAANDASSDHADWESAQDEALTRISDVVNSGLLMLSGEEKQFVCLHHCVRDLLLSGLKTEVDSNRGKMMLLWSPPHSGEQRKHWLSDFFGRWEFAEMIFMSGCDLQEIPMDLPTECSALRCLFFKGAKLVRFPQNFFHGMTCLRVVDLGNSDIQQLPTSFGDQVVNLKYLDLSFSKITELPEDVGKLRQLVYLNLKFTEQLEDIPCSCFAELESLREFIIIGSAFRWTWNDDGTSRSGRRQATLQNLKNVRTLRSVEISLQVDAAIISGLQSSQVLLGCIQALNVDFRNLKGGMEELHQMFEIVERMGNLREIWFDNVRGYYPSFDGYSFLSSSKLADFGVHNWTDVCDLAWSRIIPRLQTLIVSKCKKLSVLFPKASEDDFPRLRKLVIQNCPNLNSISSRSTPMLFPSLEVLKVTGCPKFRCLSFQERSAEKIKTIRGSQEWWNALEWENDAVRFKLLPHFIAI